MHYCVESATTDTGDITGDLNATPARVFVVPDGATGDWSGWGASIAQRNPSLELWARIFPRVGDQAYVQDDETLLVYTTMGWQRFGPAGLFVAGKNGAQTLTGSYANITGWNSPTQDHGDLASIDTTTGVLTFLRKTPHIIRIEARVELLHTTGTQGLSCSGRILLDPGDGAGFASIGEGYEAVIAAQPRKHAIAVAFVDGLAWNTTAATMKIQGIHHSGTGAADVAAAGTTIIVTECPQHTA